jgi:hypothetical protein
MDGLRNQLEVIRRQELDVVWQNFVHEKFRDKTSPADVRRRHLLRDLSAQDKPVALTKLVQVSSRVTTAYARKTAKTVSRDINALIEMDLVEKDGNSLRARRELILAFLPIAASVRASAAA